MTQSKSRNSLLSPEQLRKATRIVKARWDEAWSTASKRHRDEQRFAHTRSSKEKSEDKYNRFAAESGFSSGNRTHDQS
jgi:hypothetical protein